MTVLNAQCTSPAKLILCGEHAVLYDCTAISMAIDLNTLCEITVSPNTETLFSIQLDDFDQHSQLSEDDFISQFQNLEQRYNGFLQNQKDISDVLQQPIELILCSLGLFNKQHPLLAGKWAIKIQSEIPIGRGMGSSASVIISLLKSLYKLHGMAVDQQALLELAQQIESFQHGKSSGIDPATILSGGLIEYQKGSISQITPSETLAAFLIDTGKPQSSTGEAVNHVKKFAKDQALWSRFKDISSQMTKALKGNDFDQIGSLIHQNQKLLEHIEVVPEKVSGFINKLEQEYSAKAKICGSGSIKGDGSGVILCLCDQAPIQLCEAYNYPMQTVTLNTTGAQCL